MDICPRGLPRAGSYVNLPLRAAGAAEFIAYLSRFLGEPLKIKQRQEGEVAILELSGKIMGGDDFDLFKGAIDKLVEEGHIDVLLNMSGVRWINSTGLGLIVSAYSSLIKGGGQMKVCEVSDRIDNIFHVTQLELLCQTFDKEADAIKSFTAEA